MSWFSKKPPIPYVEIKDLAGKIIFVAPRADLWKQDFRGIILHNADLRRVGMDHSNFEDANFMGSKMVFASFRGANLRNANLTYCDLSGVDFTGASRMSSSKISAT
jgi:uncharacterized protein YjbI with pentapeptide repeats